MHRGSSRTQQTGCSTSEGTCMRSKDVDFHTKSTLNPTVQSVGTFWFERSSSATSSVLAAILITCP